MITHNLGYPRIGSDRELKKWIEAYWHDELDRDTLMENASALRKRHWNRQHEAGLDLVPVNDFSFYDQVLDMVLTVGAVPERFQTLLKEETGSNDGFPIDTYSAMARGLQEGDYDVEAMEMTKWFDTNYHYIVPEFTADQSFNVRTSKVLDELKEAQEEDIPAKPVILGPVSFLLLGKEVEDGFHRLDLLDQLLPVYQQILHTLSDAGADWIQLDEPYLIMDLDEKTRQAYKKAYETLTDSLESADLLVATYFGDLRENASLAADLPVSALHLDLIRGENQLEDLEDTFGDTDHKISLGLVNGRNIWKKDLDSGVDQLEKAADQLDKDRLMLAPSCSLLHVPHDLEQEDDETALPGDIKRWLAFARQKLDELELLRGKFTGDLNDNQQHAYEQHQQDVDSKSTSTLVHNDEVKERVNQLDDEDMQRDSEYPDRRPRQQQHLDLPLFPTTTIGSFPQTKDVRHWRAEFKKGNMSREEYHEKLKGEIKDAVEFQEEIGIDLLVHGEPERNDMVEYFGERLSGFVFTRNGWVQSYGSRCVKPPIIYGDVERPEPITVGWSSYASSLTDKPVKGMLTGPVTMLEWSFVRNDQPRSETTMQLALAIRDEVEDLEEAGVHAIQIDEPALREGLPLKREDWDDYLEWAVNAFRVASTVVDDETQIHTHMCYAEFNDIIEAIAGLDADVISLEASRSKMELLDVFEDFEYPNEIGPGVYDIHSPRIPSTEEMAELIDKATDVLDPKQVWVNPDCGLKTRGWEETRPSLRNMVQAAEQMRQKVKEPAE